MARKKFFIWYNGKYIADFCYLSGAIKYIKRKDLKSDLDNSLSLVDWKGNSYHPFNGMLMR